MTRKSKVAIIRETIHATTGHAELDQLHAVNRFAAWWEVNLEEAPLVREQQLALIEVLRLKGYRIEWK